MKPTASLDSLRATFAERGIRKVKVGGFDVDGVLRGKYMSLDKLWSVVEGGLGFCEIVFGWDITDTAYDNAGITNARAGFPDVRAVVDLSTFRVLPGEPDTAAFLVDFETQGGADHPACPRRLLKRVLARAEERGYRLTFGTELEFWVFKETPESLQEKGFRDLTPLSPGMYGYSWLRSEQNRELCHAILDEMSAFDIPIEALHTETGPGVYEVAIRCDDALAAADKAALFKTQMKSLAARRGLAVTFMAKVHHDLPGASGHLHQSLWSRDGRPLFHDERAERGFSRLGRHWVGGQVALMSELTALHAPTVNSYRRFVSGLWAPLRPSWGFDHRTSAIRVVGGSPGSTRVEFRQSAADINPYVSIAACVAAGLWGIDNAVDPPPPANERPPADHPLPRSLGEATALLASSARAHDILGEAFIDHWVRTRDWEARQAERIVTEWERQRYFEAI